MSSNGRVPRRTIKFLVAQLAVAQLLNIEARVDAFGLDRPIQNRLEERAGAEPEAETKPSPLTIMS